MYEIWFHNDYPVRNGYKSSVLSYSGKSTPQDGQSRFDPLTKDEKALLQAHGLSPDHTDELGAFLAIECGVSDPKSLTWPEILAHLRVPLRQRPEVVPALLNDYDKTLLAEVAGSDTPLTAAHLHVTLANIRRDNGDSYSAHYIGQRLNRIGGLSLMHQPDGKRNGWLATPFGHHCVENEYA